MARIVRTPKTKRFLIISNSVCRDRRLSYRARGVLAHILSLPDRAEVSSSHLARHPEDPNDPREGRDAVLAALKELQRVGYLPSAAPAGGRRLRAR